MAAVIEIPLAGGGGERVDLWRTIVSHGIASLPPAAIDEETRTLELTVPLGGFPARALRVREGRNRQAAVEPLGSRLVRGERARVIEVVRRILNLDEDLSGFYELVAEDPDLKWVAGGSGRMLRSPTVFEDVVKTVCTTNCTWSATIRMVSALVEHLGEPAEGAAADGPSGRAFPTPEAMARVGERFYRDTVRAGYRGAYLKKLALSVADGVLDLEALKDATAEDLPDGELAKVLLALPGVGPYAAAHIMMLLGRHSQLILDSWTRPTYARLAGRRKVADATIARRFRRYGPYSGLAFWLYLTRDWVAEGAGPPPELA